MPGTDRSVPTLRRAGIELFAISFVVLFQELALIRWLPGQVRVLAYFPNLILLSAFLGLGIGCLRAQNRALLWLWPATLLALAAMACGMSGIAFTQNSATEHLWLLYHDLGDDAPVVGDVRLPIVLCFLVSALSFVPLGQQVAQRLQVFRSASLSLWGYACDILGSLFGVAAFAALGFAGTPPVAWFAAFLAAGAVLFAAGPRRLGGYLGMAAAILLIVQYAERAQWYSPYYAISTRANGDGVEILTNGSLHQSAIGLDRDGQVDSEWLLRTRDGYHLPYRRLLQAPRRVLVLGAGTGNDVAVALDEGAERVDAVEIDPVILSLGDQHPNRPYASPRVRRFNTDARAFLNESKDEYDLIVFGTLDSMTKLSALSNVRLDNFVYTRESLRAAREHLAPGGGIVMYFAVLTDYIDQRLAAMLAAELGETPVIEGGNYNLFNRIYLAGPAFSHLQSAEREANTTNLSRLAARLELPGDDWPYLYLRARAIDGFYVLLIAIFAAAAVIAVAATSRQMRDSLRRGGIDGEMFFFGLAFLLLETKSVTTMSLLWGATWLTSAVVFGAILFTVLAATILMQLRPLPWAVCMGGLFATLLIAYAVPAHSLLRVDPAARLGLSVLFVGAPIFFAAAGFAILFRDREEADTAFGWNLLGAVAGGLVEFVSMITGLKALYLLALAAYLLAVLIRMRARATLPGYTPQTDLASAHSE